MDKEAALSIALKYVDYLKQNNFDIVKALLFGSYARGNFNNDSDIDLAIVFKEIDDKFKIQVKLLILASKFDTRIEPHPFDQQDIIAGNSFVTQIFKYGIEII